MGLVVCWCIYTDVQICRFRFAHTFREILENFSTCWRASILSTLWASLPTLELHRRIWVVPYVSGFSAVKNINQYTCPTPQGKLIIHLNKRSIP